MRTMADSVTAADLPDGKDLYAAYIDGEYADYTAAVARFGADKVVPVTVDPTSAHGIVGDGPPDNGTWTKWVAWVGRRREAGADPTMYTDGDQLAAGREAFAAQGVGEPHWWVASWTGTEPTELPAGVVALQYASPEYGSGGHFDLSVVATHWPGVDPAPVTGHYDGFPGVPIDPTLLPAGEVVKLPNGLVVVRAGPGAVEYVNPHDTPGRAAAAVPWDGPVAPAPAPAPAAPSPPTPAPQGAYSPAPGLPLVRTGQRGPVVRVVQHLTVTAGYGPLAVDGMFGPATEAAVKRFQSGHQLAVDGIVGPHTWGALA